MSPVVQSASWGAVAALPLLVGAGLAPWRKPTSRFVGFVAAFGAGALLSAVSFELVADAIEKAPPGMLAAALAAGAIAYYAGGRAISRRLGQASASGARGLALLLGATLDGIPESFILGSSLAAAGGVGISFFVAVLVSNFPEGMASAAELSDNPQFPPRRLLLMWTFVVGISAVAAGIGALVAARNVEGAVAQAFAAGALLTMLTDDLIPEAREKAGIGAGLMAVFGFAVALALHRWGG